MGKAVGAFVRFVFAVIILALLGYNTFETWRLRQEVNALKQARSGSVATAGKSADGSAGGGSGATPLDRLSQARAHTERARALMAERRFAEAQRELARATQAVRDAGGDARSQSAAAVENLRTTVERLSAQADSLMGSEEDAKAGTPGERRGNDQKERTGR